MPDMIYVVAALIFAVLILQSSSNKDEKQTKETIKQMSNPPKHAIVSGMPSPGAVALSIVVVVVLCIAATHGMK